MFFLKKDFFRILEEIAPWLVFWFKVVLREMTAQPRGVERGLLEKKNMRRNCFRKLFGKIIKVIIICYFQSQY